MAFKFFLLWFVSFFSMIGFAQIDSNYAINKWKFVDFGDGIGSANIITYDFDKDGTNEIILSTGNQNLNHLRILKYINNDYKSTWISKNYGNNNIKLFTIKDIDKDSTDELIVVRSDGTIEQYDLNTLKIKSSNNTTATNPSAFDIGDTNEDGVLEYIFVRNDYYQDGKYLKIINSDTYEEEYYSSSFYANDVKVGDADNDGKTEIILSTGKVLDGLTRTLEWEYSENFGSNIRLFDIDQDSVPEIIALTNYYIRAFDAEFKTPLWEINSSNDLQSIFITDYDDDDIPDIIVGNNQWGSIKCYRTSDRKLVWSVQNPLSGTTNIMVSDLDNDGVKEIMWGGGQNSTGEDVFYIADPLLNKIEWKSQDIDGPFHISAHDVDNDEFTEIIGSSSGSRSGYDGGILNVFDSNYEIVFSQKNGSGWDNTGPIYACNFDDEKSGEIIYSTGKNLYILDGVTHEYIYQNSFPSSITSIKIQDIDEDKVKEIIVGDNSGYITIIDSKTFNQEWQSIKTGGSIGKIIIGDYDNDDAKEIIFYNNYGSIQVYDGRTHYLEWQAKNITGITAFDFADVDMDGVKEFVVGLNDGRIMLVDSKTSLVESEFKVGSESITGLTVANLDSSLGYEIITGTSRISIFNAFDFSKKWESELLGTYVGFSDNILVKDLDNDGYNDILVGSNWGIFHYEITSKYPDITPPFVKSHLPLTGQMNIGIDTKVEIVFSEKINISTIIDNISIQNGKDESVPFSYTYDDSLYLSLQPDSLFTSSDTIKVLLTTKIIDNAGNSFDGNRNGISEVDSIDNYTFWFMTGSGIDTVGPVFTTVNFPDTIWRGTRIKIKAILSDYSSIATTSLKYAEYFIDTVSTFGTGIPLVPDDGEINSVEESFSIELNTEGWNFGEHTIFLASKDIKDNWGEPAKIKIFIRSENPSNWVMFGYNAQHTGFNEGDSISADLSLIVNKKISSQKLGTFTVVNDKVIFPIYDYGSKKVFCCSIDNGDIIWSIDFKGVFSCNPLSFAYGNLYLQINNHSPGSFLYSLDLNTGKENWKSPFEAQWGNYLSPTVSDGKVFINGGYYGGIYAFDAANGEQLWFGNLAQYDRWTPAIWNNVVYTYVDRKITAFEPNTGRILWEKVLISDSGYWDNAPVIDTETNIIITTSHSYLHVVDLNTRIAKWMQKGIFNIKPAVYNKNVFAIKNGMLMVYNIEKGDSLWSFKGKTNFSYSPVISNGLVFVSSESETYAIKIEDHEAVWKYSKGGEIVVSNNKLFIGTTNGELLIFEKGISSDISNLTQLPTSYKLLQNYPNPFNPSTTIEYHLPDASNVRIQVFNVMGELVETLVDKNQEAGYHKIVWDAYNYASGVYFSRLIADNANKKFVENIKMLFLK